MGAALHREMIDGADHGGRWDAEGAHSRHAAWLDELLRTILCIGAALPVAERTRKSRGGSDGRVPINCANPSCGGARRTACMGPCAREATASNSCVAGTSCSPRKIANRHDLLVRQRRQTRQRALAHALAFE